MALFSIGMHRSFLARLRSEDMHLLNPAEYEISTVTNEQRSRGKILEISISKRQELKSIKLIMKIAIFQYSGKTFFLFPIIYHVELDGVNPTMAMEDKFSVRKPRLVQGSMI